MDQIHEGRLITCEDPIRQDVPHLDDRPLKVHAGRHGQSFAGFFIGTGNPVRTRMRAAHRDPPRGPTSKATELAMNDLAEVTSCRQATGGRRRAGDVRQCQDHNQTFLGCHQHISITKPIQYDAFECAGGGRDRWESLRGLGEGDLMGAGQIQARRVPLAPPVGSDVHPHEASHQRALDEAFPLCESARDRLRHDRPQTTPPRRPPPAAQPRPRPVPRCCYVP